MKKIRTVLVLLVLIVLIIIIARSYMRKDYIKSYSGGHKLTNLSNVEDFTIDIPLLDENTIQTVRYKDMSISMIGCVYDEETTIGYSIFKVSCDKGFGKDSYQNDMIIYNDEVFEVARLITGAIAYKAELSDDGTLYINYLHMGENDRAEESKIYFNKIGTKEENIGEFDLKKDVISVSRNLIGDYDGTISSLGIRINTFYEGKFTVKYVDGSTEVYNMTDSGKEKSIDVFYKYVENLGDISEIVFDDKVCKVE